MPRMDLAKRFLQEAVYRSRAGQAAGVGLSGRTLDRPASPADCGLGKGPTVELDLSNEGRAIFRELWPDAGAVDELERIQGVMRDWVERQDAIDRRRNHFMRDFRNANGFDRTNYGPEVLKRFEGGLADINADADSQRNRAAHALLGLVLEEA